MTEHRDRLPVEFRATEQAGEHFIDLQAITVGVVDDYGSVWEPHTFDTYAQKRLPVLCWTHSWADPIGRGVEYTPSANGPRIRFTLDDFTVVPRAAQAFAQVKSGTIRDCSVGFSNAKRRDPTDEEIEQYPGVREIIFEAELDEVSLVLRGAVPGAKVLSVRRPGASLAERRRLARMLVDREITIDQFRAGEAFDSKLAEAEREADEVLERLHARLAEEVVPIEDKFAAPRNSSRATEPDHDFVRAVVVLPTGELAEMNFRSLPVSNMQSWRFEAW